MAGRRLAPDEAALWRRVTGSVRAMRLVSAGQTMPKNSVRAEPVEALHFLSKTQAKKDSPSTSSGRTERGNSVQTLDGTWDKTIAAGRIRPDQTIDLHGYNLAAAHHRLDRGLDDAIRDGARVILLITGKAPRAGSSRLDSPLRGIIRESVGDWLAASRHQPAIAAIRSAHPRHGGAGALYIVLRRKRG
jgi:DNA-nicking Smr family endonuclease